MNWYGNQSIIILKTKIYIFVIGFSYLFQVVLGIVTT